MSENGQKPELVPCYEKKEFRIRSRSYAYENQEFQILSNFHEKSSGDGDVSFLRRIRSPDFNDFHVMFVTRARPFTMTVYFESILFFCCIQAHSMCLLPLCRIQYVQLVHMKAFEAGLVRY